VGKSVAEFIGNGHTCDPATVQSVELILKETKACPKCTVPITRIAGCAQMFCTSCNAAFNWNTGAPIDTRLLHNPHYFEFLAKSGRQQQLNQYTDGCYDIVLHSTGEFSRQVAHRTSKCTAIAKMYRNYYDPQIGTCVHIHSLENRYRRASDEHIVADRIKYLNSELSDEEYRKQLYRTDQLKLKSAEILPIYNVFRHVVNELFDEIYNMACNNNWEGLNTAVERFETEFPVVREIANTALAKLAKLWNTKLYLIDAELNPVAVN
jgi:hypothetical protein